MSEASEIPREKVRFNSFEEAANAALEKAGEKTRLIIDWNAAYNIFNEQYEKEYQNAKMLTEEAESMKKDMTNFDYPPVRYWEMIKQVAEYQKSGGKSRLPSIPKNYQAQETQTRHEALDRTPEQNVLDSLSDLYYRTFNPEN